jgi:1-acyl-sn-glycerol-3-phosphate acyltransferase
LLALIHELHAELHPHGPPSLLITLDSSLDRDIGLDSLSRLELLGRAEERFHVTLSEKAFTDAETPRDLLRAIQSAPPVEKHALRDVAVAPPGVPLGETKDTPHTAETLIDVLDWHVERHGDRPHVLFYQDDGKGDSIAYGELGRGAGRIAAGLVAKGLEPGEPVAIMLPPNNEYFFSFFGVLLAGGIPVPLYPPARPARIEEHLRRHVEILNNCAAKILVTVREALRFTQFLTPHVESLRHVVTAAELAEGKSESRRVSVKPHDVGLIQYTSGSTGDPKGVVLTHANLLANIRAIGGAVRMDSKDVGVSWLPLYHDMGLIGAWLCSLYYASLLVIMSPFDFLARPERWLWAIHRHRATLSVGPNFAYEICVHRLKDGDVNGLDLSSWRVAFNGAEPVSPDTIARFSERFAAFGFRREAMMPVYGLAECTVGLAFPPYGRGPIVDRTQRERLTRDGRAIPAGPDDSAALRFVACGRPLSGHEIRIVDPGGHELPDGYEGRLQFRGPSATSGYYRNPEATRALFDGPWLNSGDLAYVSGGDIYITGRSKDLIIRAGRNIYPHELEAAVGNIPGVRKGNVAVFGTTDHQTGTERLVVMVEARENDPNARERIRTEIYGVTTDIAGTPPDDVVFVPRGTIPKTTSGKIRRSASRALYERGKTGEKYHAVWWQVVRLTFFAGAARSRRFRRRVSEIAYTGYALGAATLLGLVSWLAVACCPRLAWRWAVVRWAARMVWRATCAPILVNGSEHFPRDGRCVIVSNHASYLDSFVLAALLPMPVSFVAKSELKRNPFVHHFLRRLDTEFVDRWDKERRAEDTERIKERAREDRTLLFFSEGGMSRRPGLKPFKMGAFVAAAEAGLPVVPVAIRGTRSMLRPDTHVLRRGGVTVTVGAVIDTQKLRDEMHADPWTAARRLRELTRDYILRHCGEPDLGGEGV